VVVEFIGVDQGIEDLVHPGRGHVLEDQASEEPLGGLLPGGVVDDGKRASRGCDIRMEANL
jgi:hypothetical protein